jgi:hypothetical protein
MANLNQVIRKIIDRSDKIREVTRNENEFYFRYEGHAFSLMNRTNPSDIKRFGDYTFYIYPTWTGALELLIQTFEVPDENPPHIAYHVADSLGMRDALIDLYKILEEKYLKVDEIFKNILED